MPRNLNLLTTCYPELRLISIPQLESMLYAAYLNELPPIRTFLSKRPERDKPEPRQKETVNQAQKNQSATQAPAPEEEKPLIEFMLVQDAALKLKLSDKTIRRRLESGELKGKKDKGKWLIDKTAFESYLNTL
ncbi:MAG: helix-turn-helix domain-containing protein, partial [Paludibacter sp.]